MEQTDTVENLKKVTNRKQFETLVKIMEENANLARGFSGFGSTKMEYGRKWKEFGEILNNLGPPTRNGDGWLKVWNDFKTKIKKKIIINKKEFKTTGGGCNRIVQLSPLEEAVERLLNLNKIVEPSGDVVGVRHRTSQPEAYQLLQENEELDIEQTENNEGTSNREQVPTQRREQTENNNRTREQVPPQRRNMTKKNEKLEMLRSQTKYLKYMEGHSKKRTEYLKKIYELKKNKMEIYENSVQEKMKMMKEENTHKIELIILQKKEIALRLQEHQNKECSSD